MIWGIVLFLLTFLIPNEVLASNNAIIVVNQVRGVECCEAGNTANLQLQLESSVKLDIPMTFALRFDVFEDSESLELLQKYQLQNTDLISFAGFLEITPSLAKAAGVRYSAPERDWYKTQHVYPPGYSVADRYLLIDAYMERYHQIFKSYPSLTVGWFVDTTTLNYLYDKYQVKVHELTREQWGTDSYSLDGGSFPYPYFASRNWSFIPSSTPSGLTIIRQTIPHAAQNYGDHTSSATSQPNDYLRSHSREYFQDLIKTLTIQPAEQKGFGVLGLENSFNQRYQQEFIDGLSYIKANFADSLIFINPSEVGGLVSHDLVKIYQDDVGGTTATWVITNHYRLRILSTNSKLIITDLRFYSDDLSDPYSKDNLIGGGYWVAPYLINGSRWFAQKQFWLKQILKPIYNEGYGARSDIITLPTHLAFPSIDSGDPLWSRDGNNLILTYNSGGNPVKLNFEQTKWSSSGLIPSQLKYQDNSGSKFKLKESKSDDSYSLSFMDEGKVVYGLNVTCQSKDCSFIRC
jgi:hypothetical protein